MGGATTFAYEMKSLSAGFGFYVMVGFRQFFVLGVTMIRCKTRDEFGEVQPLASRGWPFILFLLTILSPTTNWIRGGNLTFPFYTGTLDRCLYIGYAVVVIFILD